MKTKYVWVVTSKDITKDGAVLPSGVRLHARSTKRGWKIDPESQIWPGRFLPTDSAFEPAPLELGRYHSQISTLETRNNPNDHKTNFDLQGLWKNIKPEQLRECPEETDPHPPYNRHPEDIGD